MKCLNFIGKKFRSCKKENPTKSTETHIQRNYEYKQEKYIYGRKLDSGNDRLGNSEEVSL